jgi:hypothetical protein
LHRARIVQVRGRSARVLAIPVSVPSIISVNTTSQRRHRCRPAPSSSWMSTRLSPIGETPEPGAAAVGAAMKRGGALVVPQFGSAVAEAQAMRVVPGLAGAAVGLPVLHRGAGGLEALGLGWRVQPRMQR